MSSSSPMVRTGWASLAALLGASAAVIAAGLLATYPPGSFELRAASLGRVLFGAGCGACLGAAGALRLQLGQARALAELEMLAGVGGAIAAAWLAAALAPESATVIAGLMGAVLGGGGGVWLVHAIDRPTRASNLAAAGIVAAAGLAISFALPLAGGDHPQLTPLLGWLFGDLSRATLETGAAMGAVGLVVALLATRSAAGPGIALFATAAVWAAAGPLVGVAGATPRAVRRFGAFSPAACVLASAAVGAAAVVGIDAAPRILLGGFATPFNVAVVYLAPIWLLWNRSRLGSGCGSASRTVAIAEWLAIATLAGLALLVIAIHYAIVSAAY